MAVCISALYSLINGTKKFYFSRLTKSRLLKIKLLHVKMAKTKSFHIFNTQYSFKIIWAYFSA